MLIQLASQISNKKVSIHQRGDVAGMSMRMC